MRFIIEIEPGYNGDYGQAPDMTPEEFAAQDTCVTDGYYTWNITSIEPAEEGIFNGGEKGSRYVADTEGGV